MSECKNHMEYKFVLSEKKINIYIEVEIYEKTEPLISSSYCDFIFSKLTIRNIYELSIIC